MDSFKGLGLVDRVPEELWMEVCTIVQQVVTKTILREKNTRRQSGCVRSGCVKALQITEKRREAKGKGEKERYTHLNAEF